MSLKEIYYNLEDKWFEMIDFLDRKGIPSYKAVDPLEMRGIPSLPVYLIIFILLLGFAVPGLVGMIQTEETTRTRTTDPVNETDEYKLIIDIEGEGITDPEPGNHTYEEEENIKITAIPDTDWYFQEWTGDHNDTKSEIDITIDQDKNITAHFKERKIEEYELKIDLEGQGNTDPEPGLHTYEEGEQITITTTSDEDWKLEEFTGDCTGETCTLTMNEDKEITAIFDEKDPQIDYHHLTVEIEGEGNTFPGPGTHTYEKGEEVTVTTSAEENWKLEEFTGDCTGETCTLTMNEDKEITVKFTEDEPEYYNLITNIEGEGDVEIDPDQDEYEEDEEVTVTAIPDEDWYFQEWTGDIPEEQKEQEEITLNMTENKNITAHFTEETPKYRELTINTEGNGETNPEQGTHEYTEGTEVEVEATPEEGWYFQEWTGDHTSTEEEITVTMDEDKEITAHFQEEIENYTLTTNIDGEGEVDAEPEQDEYEEGTEVTLTAQPDEYWEFNKWTGDLPETTYERTNTLGEWPSCDTDDQENRYRTESRTGGHEDCSICSTGETTWRDESFIIESCEAEAKVPEIEGSVLSSYTCEPITIYAKAIIECITEPEEEDSETITVTMDEDKEITANFEIDEDLNCNEVCTDWEDETCGGGGCHYNKMQQTRDCEHQYEEVCNEERCTSHELCEEIE